MSVQLDHTIIHATDKFASARFLAELAGLEEPTAFGPFAAVSTANGLTIDYAEHVVEAAAIVPQHLAFRVSEEEFDAIFARIQERELPYWADPYHHKPQEINHLAGGRGVYVSDPDGHAIEFLTRKHSLEDLGTASS
ncbi:chaP protein [Streptomyces chrestomyceticus JCM 4735]|uniref:ChaP protein n=1 Tax=Streptomyces chrestomyceticus JCM 4735 TaxID=1306181 RepID=A0A7U9Q013_9ACTN|nr:VOC family protein [Streptomyces chrestomyceticus]GCD37370.1 chaP protein [Streptomyces chrestomyceticus JCM 4735]